MNSFKEFIEFILQYRDSPIEWVYIIISTLIIIGIFLIPELIKIAYSKPNNFLDSSVKAVIGVLLSTLIIWICGGISIIVAIPFGILAALFIRNKYFDFLKLERKSSEDITQEQELQKLKKAFRDHPHYSILEVLLYYDYISPLHKEHIETENIFETPEEMAKKLLNMPVLTDKQLKEAKAIMNIIRREGKILTKQDALLIVANLEERRISNEESSDDGN